MIGYYGKPETWKIVYTPKPMNFGMKLAALVEADCHQMAMYTFMKQYEGQYTCIDECKKLFE